MEVGAVKQAFNNEVILLKKQLNQAKIQIIHKLTRKAKTLTQKKAPEKLKEKLNKKAESAVKEVLIMKKIKPKDLAKFIVTHKGQLNEYLNRPIVDQDKACARLLLHKALKDKYQFIRERFSNISIEDLLMSRLERRKLKKEEREKQKNSKAKKGKGQVPTDSNWYVEEVNNDNGQTQKTDDDIVSSNNEHEETDEEYESDSEHSSNVNISANYDSSDDDGLNPNAKHLQNKNENIIEDSKAEATESNDDDQVVPDDEGNKEKNVVSSIGTFVKITPTLSNSNNGSNNNSLKKLSEINENPSKKKLKGNHKDNNKNKNLKNKILMKKFNKVESEVPVQENKVVDPFFITATGENYMSLSEPRQPDEVKDVHKQGNRKYRRAVMFGHVPIPKVSRDKFRSHEGNTRLSKVDSNRGNFNKKDNSNGFSNHSGHERYKKSDGSINRDDFKGKNSYGKRHVEDEVKPEKLHPSWEAKKRQSGILPFQGKKIVFDEG